MMEFGKSVTQLILVLGVLVSCNIQETPTAPLGPAYSTGAQEHLVPSVRSFIQRATETANKWRSDAYLIDAHISFSPAQSPGSIEKTYRISFDFESKSNADSWYTVGFDMKDALDVFEFHNSTLLSHDIPIEPNDWQIDSTEAWQIVLANGGRELLARYNQSSIALGCSITLERWNPPHTGKVHWRLGCLDPVTRSYFTFLLDAATGEVVEKQPR